MRLNSHIILTLLFLGLGFTESFSQLAITVTITDQPTCADPLGGQVHIEVSGGTAPYSVIVNGISDPTYAESIVGTIGQTDFFLPDAGHAPLGEGAYAISVIDALLGIESETILLMISQPVVTVPATIQICENDADDDMLAPLRVSASPAGGTFTFSGSGVSPGTSLFDPSGLSGLVTITVQYDLGSCSVTEMFDYDVKDSPTPVISGDNSVCAGDLGIPYSTPAVAGHAYVWNISGGTIASGGGTNAITVNWGLVDPGVLTVQETILATGCVVTTLDYNVTINPIPTPVITGDNTACSSQLGVPYSTAGTAGHSYLWTVVGGSVASGAGTNAITVDWAAAGAGTLTVQETILATGCTFTTGTYNVSINPNPAPVITSSNTVVCDQDAGEIYFVPVVAGDTYAWTVIGGTITSGSGTNSITVTWDTPGGGDVSILQTTTLTGCTGTVNEPIVINPLPTPVISGNQTVCAGDLGVTYSTPNVAGNTYAWSAVGGAVVSGAGTNSITVDWGVAGPGTITVMETITATGCVVTTSFYNVTINPQPTPVITGNNSVCANDLGIAYSTPDVVGNTYLWTVVGGTTVSGAGTSAITVDWGVAGPGTITLQETIISSGCSVTTGLYNVTINPNPTPSITSSNIVVCEGDIGEIYSVPLVVGDTYSWTITGGTITSGAGTNSIIVSWITPGIGNVNVVQTTTLTGCTGSADEPITINPLPTPVITGDNTACSSQLGVAYSTAGTAGHSYLWTVVGGSVASGAGTNAITVDWAAAGAGTITVQETILATGCTFTTGTYNVSINPNPAPVITSGNTIVCDQDAGEIYFVPVVAGDTYAWTVTGGTITAGAGTNSITVTWDTPGGGDVSIIQTTTLTGCTGAANEPIVINPLPTPVISGNTSVCANDLGVAYSTPNVAGNTYAWSVLGGAVASGAGTNSITVDWGAAGPGTVSVLETITASGCAVTTLDYNVTIDPQPTPVITGANSVCANDLGLIYSTPDVVGNTYLWTVVGGTIVSGTGTSAITVDWGVAGPGTITLQESITSSGCSVTTGVFNVIINPNPVPVITSSNTVVCEGDLGEVYSVPLVVGDTYAWTVTGGTITSGTGTNSITVSWTIPGAGNVNIVQTTTLTSCTGSADAPITINPLPTPVITGDNAVCPNELGIVYTTPDVVGNSYLWTVVGGSVVSGAGTSSITVDWAAIGGTLTVLETIVATGCSVSTATYNVSVNAVPSSMTMTGPVPICEDNTADLDLQITGGIGPFEVDLSYDDGLTTVNESVPIADNSLISHETPLLVATTTISVTEVRDLGTGCTMDPANFATPVIVVVEPKATIDPISDISACLTDVTVQLSGIVGGSASTGVWTLETNGVPINLSATTPGGPMEFVATYTIDIADIGTVLTFRLTTDDPIGACTAEMQDVDVDISDAIPMDLPDIVGPADVCTTSTSVIYTATAVADATTYLWTSGSATILSGQGTQTLEIDFSTASGIVPITVFGANGCGNGPVQTFNVNVNSGPVIDTQPMDQSACEATDAMFMVAATGNSLTYQWEESSDGIVFTAISGETNASLTISAVDVAEDGRIYQAVVTSAGCPLIISDPATLTVNLQAVIDTQPANQTACMDDNVTFTIGATNATSYQWEESTDGITFTPIAGAILADLQLLNVPLADNGKQFRAIAQSGGCTDVVSAFAILTVEDCTPPDCASFTVQVDNATNASCGGSNGQFTIIPAGGVAPYNIEVDKNDGSGLVQSAAEVTGLSPGTYDYRVTDSQACQFTGAVTIGEKQLVADFTEIIDPLCNGDNGSVIITVATGAGNYEFSVDNQATWTGFVSGEAVLIPPGTDYTIIVQDNTGDFCPTASPLITIGEPSMISYTVGEIIESVPERASGSVQFLSISGGDPEYVMDAELVVPTAPDQYQPQMVDRTGIPVLQDASGTYTITLDDLFAGFYQLYIRDASGCEVEVLTASDGEVEVPMDNNLFIPNVFTPNGDGVNDVFFIRNMPEDSPTSVVITNRYGKTVYDNSSYANDWDANGLSDGVYYFSVGMQTERVKGWVEVWRGTR